MKKKRPVGPPDKNDPEATAAQAGIEKALYDELTKGLAYAASALAAIDDEERQRLLGQAALAYQNAVFLAEQSTTPLESRVNKQLQTLGAFLVKYADQQEEGN